MTEQLRKLSPREVLSACKHNYAIPYSTIKRIEMRETSVYPGWGKIEISTDKQKLNFAWLDVKKTDADLLQRLSSRFGDKMVIHY
jgi:hypothetical protein